MTTFPDRFQEIHLAACASTSDYLKENLARLEADFPVSVSAGVQTAGRGRESRAWVSPAGLGIYVTFGLHLPDPRGLSLLSIASGVAVGGMLQAWAGVDVVLKWPNDILAGGRKIAGILCETVIQGERIVCLVGIGVNVNHRRNDFPPELRERAASLRLLTGAEWPIEEGRQRLAASMASRLDELAQDHGARIIGRARDLSRSLSGQSIAFHHQGEVIRGIFLDIASDGGLLLELPGGGKKIFYSGELG